MPFCTRPVYSRVLLFSIPCFGLIIYLLFIDQKQKIHVYEYMNICMCICIYMCVSIYICIYIYIHI